jgi:hypothetical protein
VKTYAVRGHFTGPRKCKIDAASAPPLALIYATTVDGKISSVVMDSTGIDSSDSKEVSQFEQYHR